MKLFKTIMLCGALALGSMTFSGCAILSKNSTPIQKAAAIQSAAYTASSVGTALAIQNKPATKPAFELAWTNLNILVTSQSISASGVQQVLDTLPVKELSSPNARIIVGGVLYLFDTTMGTITLTNSPNVVAFATGVRDGMGAALGK